MTLIIAAANGANTVLVTDRLLTRAGKLVTREAGKAALVVCDDARFGVAFAGLASINIPADGYDVPANAPRQFLTTQWMLEAMLDVAPPERLLWPMVDRFREAATKTWRSLRASRSAKATEFLFAGHLVNQQGSSSSFTATVTNFADEGRSSTDEFRLEHKTISMRYTVMGGLHTAVAEHDVEAIGTAVRDEQPANTLIQRSLVAIRRAAKQSGSSIGEQCDSLTLPRDLRAEVRRGYHSAVASRIVPLGSSVDTRSTSPGLMVFGGSHWAEDTPGQPVVLAVPVVGRNKLCRCGSGRRYKHCHGR